MTHAFLMTAYKEEMQIVNLAILLKKIIPDCGIFIHLDKKCDIDPQEVFMKISKETLNLENIRVFKQYKVNWGSFNHLRAEIALIKEAYNAQFDYFHLITGQDMPMFSSKEKLEASLENRSYIGFGNFPHPAWTADGFNRVAYCHPLNILNLKKPNHRKLLTMFINLQKNVDFRDIKYRRYVYNSFGYNSPYWSLTREVIYNILFSNPFSTRQVLGELKYAYIPEEIFYGTMIRRLCITRPPLSIPIVNDCKRYENWGEDGSHPHDLYTDEDENGLMDNNSGAIFARKFNWDNNESRRLSRMLGFKCTNGDWTVC